MIPSSEPVNPESEPLSGVPEPPSVVPEAVASVNVGGVLWIDGVGGYRIVTESRLTLGRENCAVNVMAAVSRCCGSLIRREEDWFWDGGRDSHEDVWLADGQTLPIPGPLEIRISRPSPLSATRVLKIESGQRWGGSLDAVILVCGLISVGPGPLDHIQAKDFSQTAVMRFDATGVSIRQGDRRTDLVSGQPANLEGFHILYQRDDDGDRHNAGNAI